MEIVFNFEKKNKDWLYSKEVTDHHLWPQQDLPFNIKDLYSQGVDLFSILSEK